MKRSRRAEIAKETVRILEQGGYQNGAGDWINLEQELEGMKEGTRTLWPADLVVSVPARFSEPARIEVSNESSFEAIHRIRQSRDEGARIGCLNFASAKNPGGGFLGGAQAQEEALARSSGLYASLLTQKDYYERNRKNRSCLYLDLVIHSPGVPFFRDDEGEWLDKPIQVDVVTAPAPNAGAVRTNEPNEESEIVPTLQRRAEMVIRSFERSGAEIVILGAWGCGVFRNDPREVAAAFGDLVGEGRPYSTSFREVIFAVFDPGEKNGNHRVFEEVLTS